MQRRLRRYWESSLRRGKGDEDFKLRCGKYELRLGRRTHIIGILNVTPDSFSNGGLYHLPDRAIRRGEEMVEEGADLIDVGGESTRPGSLPISIDEELRRVIPVVKELVKKLKVPISIDTYKAEVARRALDVGVHMVNDISGLRDKSNLAKVVAEFDGPVVIMHMQGTPGNMQDNPHYGSVVPEIISFLREAARRALLSGIKREKIIVDPGIGFGKRTKHNLEIIKNLREFRSLSLPILIGVSRKSLIGDVLGLPVEDRLEGTAAAVVCSIMGGAHILRVHDVMPMVRVARMVDAILAGEMFCG